MSTAGQEFKRGWTIVFAAVVGIYASLATVPFYAIQSLFGPLNQEFGWSRGDISLAITLMALGNLCMSYLTGALIDRFGSRPLALLSGLLLAGALMCLTLVRDDIRIFWLGYFLMTLAGSATLPITYTRAVNTWFDRARGLALGLTLLGTSLAALTMPHLYRVAIEHYGWQGVFYAGAALIIIAWLPVTLLFFRDRPAAEAAAQQTLAHGMTLGEAVRTRHYWTMGIAFFLVTCAMSGIVIHIINMVTDNQLTLMNLTKATASPEQLKAIAIQAAGVAGVIGLSLIVARVTVGFLVDHFFAPPIAALCFAIPAIGCYLLTGGGHGPAVLAAIMVGVALGAELDLIGFFVSRYYGMKNYGKIYSWQYVFYSAGAGLSPFAFGAAYDYFGNYDVALWTSAGCLVFAGLLMLTLPTYQRHDTAAV
jgi:MFS family permease